MKIITQCSNQMGLHVGVPVAVFSLRPHRSVHCTEDAAVGIFEITCDNLCPCCCLLQQV